MSLFNFNRLSANTIFYIIIFIHQLEYSIPQPIEIKQGHIELKNVSFKYNEDESTILKDINLNINKGDLPPPLIPTKATVSPLLILRFISFSIVDSSSLYLKLTFFNSIDYDIKNGIGAQPIEIKQGHIELKNVSFKYNEDESSVVKEETNLLSGPNNCSKYPTNAASVPTVIEPLMA
jgi:ABC-type multidrug transport system fused ATPase/permease subunit